MSDCEQGLVRLIPPATINDTTLLSSNVPETEYPAYNAGVAYASGVSVIVGHRVYRNNSGASLAGVYPPDNLTQWEDMAPTNRWRMFDLYKSTVTQNAESIIVEIKPNIIIDSISLLNLRGAYVDVISTTQTSGEVFRQRYLLRDSSQIRSWYVFYFTRRAQKTSITELKLPMHRGATIRVEIHAPGGIAQCGTLLLGKQIDIGRLQWGYGFELNSYSRIETNQTTGEVSIKAGNFAYIPEFQMIVEDNQLDAVADIIAKYRDVPSVWVIGRRHRVMTVFGLYGSFRPVVNHGTYTDCSLQIKGFI